MSNPYPPQGGKTKVLSLDYNVAAMLAYLPICCVNLILSIIILATEPKENKFARFHALQSLVLFIVYLVVMGILYVLMLVTAVGSTAAGSGAASAGGGIVVLLIYLVILAWVVIFLVASIIAMVKAYKYETWKIPGIGNFAEGKA